MKNLITMFLVLVSVLGYSQTLTDDVFSGQSLESSSNVSGSPVQGHVLVRGMGADWDSRFLLASDISGLASVALSNDYNDLINLPTNVSSIESLTDVTITSPVVDEFLSYNGSVWVNKGITASQVTFDDSGAGTGSTNVQGALDVFNNRINAVANALVFVGAYDLSNAGTGNFPSVQASSNGNMVIIRNASPTGTVLGSTNPITVFEGDALIATSDNASATDGADWEQFDNSSNVNSVAGKTGAVTLVANDVSNFEEALDDRVDALVVDGNRISTTYDDNSNTLTIDYVEPTVVPQIARIPVATQTITNNANNVITFDANTFNSGSIITNNTNEIQIDGDGIYEFTLLLNFFDNNSARVAHVNTALLNGGNLHGSDDSVVQGENYMRDSAAHDSSSIRHIDTFQASNGDDLSFSIRSHSVTGGTSNITGGWLLVKKL